LSEYIIGEYKLSSVSTLSCLLSQGRYLISGVGNDVSRSGIGSNAEGTRIESADGSGGSKTLDRGLRVLEAVRVQPEGLTVSELAEALGAHRAAIYRLLSTLVAHRLIRRAQNDRYILGMGLVELAGAVAYSLQSAAAPELRKLADETRATAHLTVLDGTDAVPVVVTEPRNTNMHVSYRVGLRFPADLAASGIAILSARPPAPGESEEVAEARERGYAITSGRLERGAVGISAPIVPINRPAEASVGVVAMGSLDEGSVAPRVIEAAAAIAREVG
jgi:DNA-binding IclR family transcriptional regulator